MENEIIKLRKGKERLKFIFPTMREPVIEEDFNSNNEAKILIHNKNNYSVIYYFQGNIKEVKELKEELNKLKNSNTPF